MNFIWKKYFWCLIFSIVFLTNCTTFKPLSTNNNISKNINGAYSNNSIADTSIEKGNTIWKLFYNNIEPPNEKLFVKFQTKNKNSLQVTFWNFDSLVGKKVLKGKLRTDDCFYTRRHFSIVPILPILWWYSNEQKRIYKNDAYLVIEQIGSRGGAAIIIAGGSSYENLWKFESLNSVIK